jgi:hypothetical protein
MRTLSVDSISDEHLRSMYHTLVHDGTPKEAAELLAGRLLPEKKEQLVDAEAQQSKKKLTLSDRFSAARSAVITKLNPGVSFFRPDAVANSKAAHAGAVRAALLHPGCIILGNPPTRVGARGRRRRCHVAAPGVRARGRAAAAAKAGSISLGSKPNPKPQNFFWRLRRIKNCGVGALRRRQRM